jgi:hypothetical protein
MNFKTTYVLFGLLAVLVGVLALVLWRGPEATGGPDYVLASMHSKTNPFPPEDIDRVEIECKRPPEEGAPDSLGTLVFEREADGKTWRVVEPRALRADRGNIDSLIRQLYDARPEENKKPISLKAGGVDKPSRVITLKKTEGGREVTLRLGDVRLATAFVAPSDGKEALPVEKTQIEAALENLAYFRSKELLGGTGEVRRLELTQGKKQTVELTRSKDRWRLVQPPYGDAEVGDLLTKLGDIRVSYKDDKDNDFVADGVTDLAKYHLDPAKNEVLRIEVRRGEEKEPTTQTLVVGVGHKIEPKDKGKDKDKFAAPPAAKYYAYLDNGQKAKDIVKVPVSAIEPFTKLLDDPGSVRNRNLVDLGSFRTPDAVDIENSHGKLEFRRADSTKPWELYRGNTASAIEDTDIQLLVSTLTKKDAVLLPFPDPKEEDKLGLGPKDKPIATVTVWADSLEKPEKGGKPKFKKDVKPAAVLRFGDLSGKRVAVERVWGDDRTLVFVPDEVRDLVRKGPLAYVDRALPAFNKGAADAAADVTKLVIEREGKTYEVTRDKSGSGWKLSKPAGREANSTVILDILGELNRPLKAVEVVAEKADASALDKLYGLKSPAYRVAVTVTKDKKSKTTEYLFGKESSDKKGVYAKVADKDTIYVVGPEVLNSLKKDLQDPTIFSFDPDKVQAIKLTGWRKAFGTPTTRAFQRKDGKWLAKDPPDFPLDPDKVAEFVRRLSALQAERFVTSGKGLKLAEDALEIESTVEGRKEPLQLTVGAAESDRSYYATSKQLKGEFFLVPQDLFKGPRGAPGYFSK